MKRQKPNGEVVVRWGFVRCRWTQLFNFCTVRRNRRCIIPVGPPPQCLAVLTRVLSVCVCISVYFNVKASRPVPRQKIHLPVSLFSSLHSDFLSESSHFSFLNPRITHFYVIVVLFQMNLATLFSHPPLQLLLHYCSIVLHLLTLETN